MQKNRAKVALVAGGTGGHIYPALALSEEIRDWGYDPLILGAPKKHLHQLLPNADFWLPSISRHLLWREMGTVQSLVKRLDKFFAQHRPIALFAFGSTSSLLPAMVARWRNIPIVCFEQNAIPGRVNRLLNPVVEFTVLQWAEAQEHFFYPFNLRIWGSPRRRLKRYAKLEARQRLGLDPQKFTILVMGGSQGAQKLNQIVYQSLWRLRDLQNQIQWVHLTGLGKEEQGRKYYRESGFSFWLQEYTEDLGLLYSCADLLLARSGGTTIWEAADFGLPMALVPYPYSTSNHQLANAQAAEACGAAVVVPQESLNTEYLRQVLTLLCNDERQKKMAMASKGMAKNRYEDGLRMFLESLVRNGRRRSRAA